MQQLVTPLPSARMPVCPPRGEAGSLSGRRRQPRNFGPPLWKLERPARSRHGPPRVNKVLCYEGSSLSTVVTDPLLDISIEEVESRLSVKLSIANSNNGMLVLTHNTGAGMELVPRSSFLGTLVELVGPLLIQIERLKTFILEYQARLAAEEARAEQLGIRNWDAFSRKHFITKLEELMILLPGVTAVELLSMDGEDLRDMMFDTASVAFRLVLLKLMFTSGLPGMLQHSGGPGVPRFIWEHPHVLSSRQWEPFLSSLPLASLYGHGGYVTAVAMLPDGFHAVSGSRDRTLRVWDLETDTCIAELSGHSSEVLAVAVTPDGRRAVSGSWDRSLRVWDLSEQRCIADLQGCTHVTDAVRSLAITPDGRRAVAGSSDRAVRVWDLHTNMCVATLVGHGGEVSSVAVTSDGRQAVTGSADKTLRVWDLESFACIATLRGEDEDAVGVTCMALTPDGRHAVSGSFGRSLLLWDLAEQRCIADLEGHSSCVSAVAITPDGRHAVSGSWDQTVRVWDLQARVCVAELFGHDGRVTSLVVTPDGRHAVSSSWDHTVRVWDLQAHVAYAYAADAVDADVAEAYALDDGVGAAALAS